MFSPHVNWINKRGAKKSWEKSFAWHVNMGADCITKSHNLTELRFNSLSLWLRKLNSRTTGFTSLHFISSATIASQSFFFYFSCVTWRFNRGIWMKTLSSSLSSSSSKVTTKNQNLVENWLIDILLCTRMVKVKYTHNLNASSWALSSPRWLLYTPI